MRLCLNPLDFPTRSPSYILPPFIKDTLRRSLSYYRCDATALEHYHSTILLPYPPISSQYFLVDHRCSQTEGQFITVHIYVVNACRALLQDRELEVKARPNSLLLRLPLNF